MHTSPGCVPQKWEPEASQELLEWAKSPAAKSNDRFNNLETFDYPRWCPYCKTYKPPRSHHCKDLGRCVLKMDHYCPWVYNAVGLHNHKYFLLFLFYASVSLTYFLICCMVRVVMDIRNRQKDVRPGNLFTMTEIVLFILQLILTLPVTISIISLMFYQLSCIMSGMTSIETFADKRYGREARRRGIRNYKWYFDFGMMYNLKQVLGNSVWDWLYVRPPEFNANHGFTFKQRHYTDKGVVTIRDPPPFKKITKKEE